jgi:hypothetical protein
MNGLNEKYETISGINFRPLKRTDPRERCSRFAELDVMIAEHDAFYAEARERARQTKSVRARAGLPEEPIVPEGAD